MLKVFYKLRLLIDEKFVIISLEYTPESNKSYCA